MSDVAEIRTRTRRIPTAKSTSRNQIWPNFELLQEEPGRNQIWSESELVPEEDPMLSLQSEVGSGRPPMLSLQSEVGSGRPAFLHACLTNVQSLSMTCCAVRMDPKRSMTRYILSCTTAIDTRLFRFIYTCNWP